VYQWGLRCCCIGPSRCTHVLQFAYICCICIAWRLDCCALLLVELLQWPKVLNAPLAEVDPELFDIIEKEKNRQCKVRSRAAGA
jgi:hypothetical protein